MRKYVLAILAAFAALATLVVPASAAPAQQDLKILHSFGYKNLLLGMKPKQAEATGLLTNGYTSGNGWHFYEFARSEGDRKPNVTVYVHDTCGVQWIDSTDLMKTTSGIGIGSTRTALVAAYPNARPDPVGQFDLVVDAPFNPGFEFAFAMNLDTNEVTWMTLRKQGPFC